MSYLKSLFLAMMFAIASVQSTYSPSLYAQDQTVVESLSWTEIVEYTKETLPLQATLVANDDGFVYLDVDDAYIHKLYPLLELSEEGFKKPPYFRRPDGIGAHITVFYVHDNIIPEEIGDTFTFELKDIVVVRATRDASFAVLQVHSPELEALRKKYGFPAKNHGHEFHISLAKKYHTPPPKRQN
jgi:hypothetical protein